ncbi:unnamed protein product [Rotaria sordida]|uniref:Uncharacterized protein n=1 Tax=Rotaria sordida TaxID=392033 RepID=A0A814WM77_9BILA|nr:unnamed protein product [Rotaria sordida]CAF4111392.1 unnamed protein product [Rotaria sordida]
MEGILHVKNDPNLNRISLHNIRSKIAIDLFNEYFNFGRSSISDERLSFCFIRPTVISINLLEFHVCLKTFYDCLYLLDGDFNQVRILYVDVGVINFMKRSVNNTEKLANLKSFWLHCKSKIFVYDELVVPFLHRIFYNEINLPSNEDIQKTFKDFKDKQIIYWSDYFPKEKKGYCRIYSYPYTLKYYHDITNHFSGGVFKYVRKVSLFDERPFQHEFFLRIEKSFPLMEELTVCNEKRQINKEFRKSLNILISNNLILFKVA